MQSQVLSLFLLFCTPGILLASWVTRTPAIRDDLGVSIEQMGLILFGMSLGAMSGILSAGWVTSRLGTKRAIGCGMALILSGVILIGTSVALQLAQGVFAGLFFFGFGMGWAEIGVNVRGAQLEKMQNRSLLPYIHGCFSLGTLIGAFIGMAATHYSIPVIYHLCAVTLLLTLVTVRSVAALHPDSPLSRRANNRATSSAMSAFSKEIRDKRLIMIGVIVLAMALSEGAANDWLPLLMVDGHGFSPTSGSLIFMLFAAGMTSGRFAGGVFLSRFGRVAVVRASALMGAAGIALIIFCDTQWVAAMSVLLWGLGASLGFPLTISAAGDSESNSEMRVNIVATLGYLAFLVGPPALGFLGQHFGLRMAMIAVLSLVGLAMFIANAVRESRIKLEKVCDSA